ncbi:Transcriptional regulatory protein LiaR [Microbacterium oxydans]|nr:Transcriptional regulatory protein LiaR [Microbacterium oxydans]
MIRVLLADDEGMIRSALAALLRLEPDIDVVAECADGEQAVAEALRLRPDVCLLDLEMPGLDGVQVAEKVNRAIATRCVVVTRHARPGCCAVPWPPAWQASCRSPAGQTRSQRSSAVSRPEPAMSTRRSLRTL